MDTSKSYDLFLAYQVNDTFLVQSNLHESDDEHPRKASDHHRRAGHRRSAVGRFSSLGTNELSSDTRNIIRRSVTIDRLADVFKVVDARFGRFTQSVFTAKVMFSAQNLVVASTNRSTAVTKTPRCEQSLKCNISPIITHCTRAIRQVGITLLGDLTFFTSSLEVMNRILDGTGHFVMKAIVVVRLHNQEVLVANVRRTVSVTVVGLKNGQGVQHGIRPRAVNGETKFLRLASTTVEIMIMIVVIS
jgi:hypothetical protein